MILWDKTPDNWELEQDAEAAQRQEMKTFEEEVKNRDYLGEFEEGE